MSYIGIDLGTSSVKVIVVSKKGDVLQTVSRRYPISYPKPLYSEQNPNDWYEQTIEALKEVQSEYKENLEAISFCGQMHGLVVLDESDQVIRPALLWNDGRTGVECDEINAYDNFAVERLTGNMALTGFTAPKIKWLEANEPETFAKINKIMLPKDYISYKLSGVFATDMSDASGTLLFDVKNQCWSDEMVQLLNLNVMQLPTVYRSYDVIGCIKDELANELGINKTCKIVIGGGDQAVGAVGTNTVSQGECSISLGTSGVVFVATDSFASEAAKGLHSFAHATGRYHQMGVMLSAAGALKWFMEDVLEKMNYDEMMDRLNTLDVDPRLLFIPYLTGERTPINDPNARGAFIGLSVTHHQIHLLQAVIEGICFGLRDSFELIKSTGVKIERATVTGGGTKSAYWNQLLADIFNIEINTINTSEGGAYGAVMLAMVGNGQYQTVEDATNDLIKVTKTYYPNETQVALYQNKYERFTKVYPAISNL